MNSIELRIFLGTCGVNANNTLTADSEYCLPDKSWVENEFSDAFHALLFDLDLLDWRPESNDCDKFAGGAAFLAHVLHARTRVKNGQALAFGQFWYVRKDGQGHAINFFVSGDEKGTPRLFFYEPQTQRIVTLTPEEIGSCDSYIV